VWVALFECVGRLSASQASDIQKFRSIVRHFTDAKFRPRNELGMVAVPHRWPLTKKPWLTYFVMHMVFFVISHTHTQDELECYTPLFVLFDALSGPLCSARAIWVRSGRGGRAAQTFGMREVMTGLGQALASDSERPHSFGSELAAAQGASGGRVVRAGSAALFVDRRTDEELRISRQIGAMACRV
jgi:hypothetical protein